MDVAVRPETIQAAGRDPAGKRGEFLSVLVPCHNEAATVGELLTRLRHALPAAEIVVIDDGSTDRSAAAIQELADDLRLSIVRLAERTGKGAAVRAGLALATRSWVVIQDADLEYDPDDLEQLAVTALTNPDCAIYGSRYLQRGKAPGGSIIPYLGVKTLAVLAGCLYGHRLSDPHTCYKMLPTALLRRLALESQGFELCAEITAKLLRARVSILEVPISYHPRTVKEGKKIGFRDFLGSARTYLACRLKGNREGNRRNREGEAPAEPISVPCVQSVFYILTRFVIGALLVIAGGMKVAPWREVALLHWLVLPAPAVFSIGAAEFIMGCFVLIFSTWRIIGWASRTVFTLYVVVLLLQLWAGESVCQCLGSRSLPLVWMLGLDTVLLLSMWWFRVRWQQPVAAARKKSAFVELLSGARIALPILVLVGIFLFGSLDAAIGYATGARLLATNSAQYAGSLADGETGTVAFELTNYSRQPVRILGAKSTCRCMALDDLPMTLPPGQSERVRVRLKARGGESRQIQRESATLIFDDPVRSVTLTVTAIVLPAP